MPAFSDVKRAAKKPPLSPQAREDDLVAELKELKKPKKQPPTTEPSPTQKQKEIAWDAPEYIYVEKTADWYWSLGIITAALAGIAIWQGNFLFALIALVGGFAVALYAVRKPRTIHISISIRGIEIDSRIYPYESLDSFWIFYHPGGVKELSIMSEKMFMPRIPAPLGAIDPNDVRELLLEFLPEKRQEESLVDVITRRLGF